MAREHVSNYYNVSESEVLRGTSSYYIDHYNLCSGRDRREEHRTRDLDEQTEALLTNLEKAVGVK
jgi:hypothetical protein